MPYSSTKELPAQVKNNLSPKQQRAFRQAFNSALKDGKSEAQAFKIAWAAAKKAGGDKAVEEARNVSADERKKLAKSGKALSDGSFPIASKADLKNAIQAYGRASNKAAVKRHIIKRAKALGATNLLPDSWKKGDSAMSLVSCKDPNCTRNFIDSASMHDHAEAVHTLSERRALVSRAVRTVHGKQAYLIDLSEDWLVYDVYDEGDYKLLKQSYSMDNSGAVKLSSTTTEVIRKIAYIPAPKVETASQGLSVLGIVISEKAVELEVDHVRTYVQTDTAEVESSQATREIGDVLARRRAASEGEEAKAKSQTPHKFKPQPGNTTVCAVCNRAQGDKLHSGS